MSDALAARIATALGRTPDPAVTAFADQLAQAAGAEAVLFYGSNLRTGSLEGVLDFYVLLPGGVEKGVWPRVSYREWDHAGQTLRAKIATMQVGTFAAAARGDLLDTTIWARFVQPSALAWCRDEAARGAVALALASAACTAVRLAVALHPAPGQEWDFWRALFRATYKAELRVEKPGREDSILQLNAGHFTGLLPEAMDAAGISFTRQDGQVVPAMPAAERRRVLRWWAPRRRLGKLLNVRRLVRATATFDGAARYAAWKVERHTGVKVEITRWREKHPVLAAPLVLYRVWRGRR